MKHRAITVVGLVLLHGVGGCGGPHNCSINPTDLRPYGSVLVNLCYGTFSGVATGDGCSVAGQSFTLVAEREGEFACQDEEAKEWPEPTSCAKATDGALGLNGTLNIGTVFSTTVGGAAGASMCCGASRPRLRCKLSPEDGESRIYTMPQDFVGLDPGKIDGFVWSGQLYGICHLQVAEHVQ